MSRPPRGSVAVTHATRDFISVLGAIRLPNVYPLKPNEFNEIENELQIKLAFRCSIPNTYVRGRTMQSDLGPSGSRRG